MSDKPAPDLDTMTVPELVAHIATAQAKLKDKQEAAAKALLAKWKAEAAENNLPFEAVMPHRSGKRRSGPLPPKFKGPHGEEWSGRGRLPKWVQEVEKAGQKREEFAI